MIEGELYVRYLSEGKGWKKLKEEVRVGTSVMEVINIIEVMMIFHRICEKKLRDFIWIEIQLEKLTKHVVLLAWLNGAGLMWDQDQAKRQVE